MAADFSTKLQSLEAGRLALQELLAAASSLEALQGCLKTSLQLGRPVLDLPPEALQLYRSLDKKTRAMPDPEVLLRLQALDRKIESGMGTLIPLVDQFLGANSGDGSEHASASIAEKIENFHRLTKTAITLRALLHQRGLQAPPLKTPVPEADVLRKLDVIAQEEQRFREDITRAVVHMEEDLNTLLNHGSCSDSMKATLSVALADLVEAHAHLDQGLSINTLPIAIEIIDASFIEPANIAVDSVVPASATGTADPGPHVEEEPPVIPAAQPENRAAQAEPAPANTPLLTWWQKIAIWIKTPWKTKWRDIDDKDKRQ
jgi:hypothetical protein